MAVTFLMEEGDKGNQENEQTNEMSPSDLIALCNNFLAENESLPQLFSTELIDPVALQFIPKTSWSSSKPMNIQSLRESYFCKKNSVSRRFEHKLWNALKITEAHPSLVKFVGVVWLNERVIKVYKYHFAKLLNIACVDGGLFHKQGNFTRHGFVELSENEARTEFSSQEISDVDYRDVHLIYHSDGGFTSSSTEESILNCRWIDPTPVSRVAAFKMSHQTDNSLD